MNRYDKLSAGMTPLMRSLSDFYEQNEELSRTIFTVIIDDLLKDILNVTENIVGDLDAHGTGILTVLPVDSMHGLIEYGKKPSRSK